MFNRRKNKDTENNKTHPKYRNDIEECSKSLDSDNPFSKEIIKLCKSIFNKLKHMNDFDIDSFMTIMIKLFVNLSKDSIFAKMLVIDMLKLVNESKDSSSVTNPHEENKKPNGKKRNESKDSDTMNELLQNIDWCNDSGFILTVKENAIYINSIFYERLYGFTNRTLIIDTPDSMDNNEAYGEIVNTMKKNNIMSPFVNIAYLKTDSWENDVVMISPVEDFSIKTRIGFYINEDGNAYVTDKDFIKLKTQLNIRPGEYVLDFRDEVDSFVGINYNSMYHGQTNMRSIKY